MQKRLIYLREIDGTDEPTTKNAIEEGARAAFRKGEKAGISGTIQRNELCKRTHEEGQVVPSLHMNLMS